MEAFFATKLDAYVTGKLSRRALVQTLTAAVAASAAPIASNAAPAPEPAMKAAAFNHLSYSVPDDFRKAADWYSKVFNLEQLPMTKTSVGLLFGKKGEKPYGVTADDVPLSRILVRNHKPEAPRPMRTPGTKEVRRKAKGVVDHFAITVADFDRDRARAELKALGVENVSDFGRYSLRMKDPFGYDLRISGLAYTALNGGPA